MYRPVGRPFLVRPLRRSMAASSSSSRMASTSDWRALSAVLAEPPLRDRPDPGAVVAGSAVAEPPTPPPPEPPRPRPRLRRRRAGVPSSPSPAGRGVGASAAGAAAADAEISSEAEADAAGRPLRPLPAFSAGGAGAGPACSPAGPGRPGRDTWRGPDEASGSGAVAGSGAAAGTAPPERARPEFPGAARGCERVCRLGAGEASSVRSTASALSPLSSLSLSESVEESVGPGPEDDGRRRLRPPREPRRRRLRTTWPSSPPPVGAGPPSPCSGRATATGSSEAGWASGTLSSDMETFPCVARWDGAPAPAGGPVGQRGAQSRMVRGTVSAPIDLVKLWDVTSLERCRSHPPPRRQHAQPTGQ